MSAELFLQDYCNTDFWAVVREYLARRSEPRPRVFRDRSNPLTAYNEDEFRMRYRLSVTCFIDLLHRIGDQLIHHTYRTGALPPVYQLLVTLRFYSSGSFQVIITSNFLNAVLN